MICGFSLWGGISQIAEKRRAKYAYELEQYKKELTGELAKVPPEKRIEPNTQIVMAALADSQYCVEEPILRSMFCKLLSSASSEERENAAHPAFPAIIKRLAPNDAELLHNMAVSDAFPYPVVNYIFSYLQEDGYKKAVGNVMAIKGQVLENYEAVAASLDILQSLGLICIDFQNSITAEKAYEPFNNCEAYKAMQAIINDDYRGVCKLDLQHGIIDITDIGRQFIEACM